MPYPGLSTQFVFVLYVINRQIPKLGRRYTSTNHCHMERPHPRWNRDQWAHEHNGRFHNHGRTCRGRHSKRPDNWWQKHSPFTKRGAVNIASPIYVSLVWQRNPCSQVPTTERRSDVEGSLYDSKMGSWPGQLFFDTHVWLFRESCE